MLKFHAACVTPVIDPDMRGLCKKPYHNHPNGCPNYGKRDTCPPRSPQLKDVFDTSGPIWVLWTEFDLGAHREKQRKRHPGWSERQLVNCRHWQGTVRKFLRAECEKWVVRAHTALGPNMANRLEFTTCPEAMGLNVTATMKGIGVTLEWPPKNTTRMVYLAGIKK